MALERYNRHLNNIDEERRTALYERINILGNQYRADIKELFSRLVANPAWLIPRLDLTIERWDSIVVLTPGDLNLLLRSIGGLRTTQSLNVANIDLLLENFRFLSVRRAVEQLIPNSLLETQTLSTIIQYYHNEINVIAYSRSLVAIYRHAPLSYQTIAADQLPRLIDSEGAGQAEMIVQAAITFIREGRNRGRTLEQMLEMRLTNMAQQGAHQEGFVPIEPNGPDDPQAGRGAAVRNTVQPEATLYQNIINSAEAHILGWVDDLVEKGFVCTIGAQIMQDPVYDSHMGPLSPKYEQQQIMAWLARSNNVHPINRDPVTKLPQRLEPADLIPDAALKQRIDAYIVDVVRRLRAVEGHENDFPEIIVPILNLDQVVTEAPQVLPADLTAANEQIVAPASNVSPAIEAVRQRPTNPPAVRPSVATPVIANKDPVARVLPPSENHSVIKRILLTIVSPLLLIARLIMSAISFVIRAFVNLFTCKPSAGSKLQQSSEVSSGSKVISETNQESSQRSPVVAPQYQASSGVTQVGSQTTHTRQSLRR